jgi:hypothetical protein
LSIAEALATRLWDADEPLLRTTGVANRIHAHHGRADYAGHDPVDDYRLGDVEQCVLAGEWGKIAPPKFRLGTNKAAAQFSNLSTSGSSLRRHLAHRLWRLCKMCLLKCVYCILFEGKRREHFRQAALKFGT